MQCIELLAGIIRQLEWARPELRGAAKGAVKPERHFAGDLEGFQGFAIAYHRPHFVDGIIAAHAQQVEHLAQLRIKSQATINRPDQLHLRGLLQLQANAVGHILGDSLGQQPQLSHATGRVVGEDFFGCRTERGQ